MAGLPDGGLKLVDFAKQRDHEGVVDNLYSLADAKADGKNGVLGRAEAANQGAATDVGELRKQPAEAKRHAVAEGVAHQSETWQARCEARHCHAGERRHQPSADDGIIKRREVVERKEDDAVRHNQSGAKDGDGAVVLLDLSAELREFKYGVTNGVRGGVNDIEPE